MSNLSEYVSKITNIKTLEELYNIKREIFGDNGILKKNIDLLKSLSIEGILINIHKKEIEESVKRKEDELKQVKQKLIDYTYFENKQNGKKHLLTKSIELLNKIFYDLGFTEKKGPDVETSYYNFDALRIPADHPARDNQDTYYIDNDLLLRTQTTAIQIHTLEEMKNAEEMRIFSIGSVYRNDTHDATHSCMFHQIEGVVIEKGITLQHLKGMVEYLASNFFEKKVKIKLCPSFFAFTEPSYEIFAYAKKENNRLIFDDSGSSIEIGGCGIIHPEILEKYNKKNMQSFAFGMGLERWIMLKYGITNIHTLYNNNINEMQQY